MSSIAPAAGRSHLAQDRIPGRVARRHIGVDAECLMVLPAQPFIVTGEQVKDVVSATPRWTKAELSERKVSRPQEGLVVIAYKVQHQQVLPRVTGDTA